MQASKVDSLPDEEKAWLEEQLIAHNFGSYDKLITILNKRGYVISRSALGRWGKSFKNRMEKIKQRLEMAKAAADYLGDDEGSTNDYLMRLMQSKLMEVMEALDESENDLDPKQLSLLTRAIADISRASVTQKKYMDEVKERVSKTAESVSEMVSSSGISNDTVNKIKNKILGIA
mgnify:CR=1 FL=1